MTMTNHAYGSVLTCFLAVMSIFRPAAQGGEDVAPFFTPARSVYPHKINPKLYPDYKRRPAKTPDWQTFENRPQIVGGRYISGGDFHMNPPQWTCGRVFMTNARWVTQPDDESFRSAVRKLKENNIWIKLGGYGPGTPRTRKEGFGQFPIQPDRIDYMIKTLGKYYLGFSEGEQDGRYRIDHRNLFYPFTMDRKQVYLHTQRYFQRISDDCGGIMTLLPVDWYWHYPIKDANIMIQGEEAMNKQSTSPMIHGMFLRGAGTQYGTLLFGNISVFSNWGYKLYNKGYRQMTDFSESPNPVKGTSLTLMKRLLLEHYQGNCAILSIESNQYQFPWKGEPEISPIGELQEDMCAFVREHPDPGAIHTPVAFMLDFFSGWMPPRPDFWHTETYQGLDRQPDREKAAFMKAHAERFVWMSMPYGPGDDLTHALFRTVYPDYDLCGLFKHEHGTLTVTPWGNMFDALLSDVTAEVMAKYPVIVAAGALATDLAETRANVDEYVAQGGNFVVTGANARRLFPEWDLPKGMKTVPAGATVVFAGGATVKEPEKFVRIHLRKLPEAARVTARVGGAPLVIEIPAGKGSVTVLLTPYGVMKDRSTLLHCFRKTLAVKFNALRLFSVGENLGYITNRRAPGKYTLGIYNERPESLPFKIVSHAGKIKSIREWKMRDRIRNHIGFGYFSEGMQDHKPGLSDDSHISAFDARIFDVEVIEENIKVREEIRPRRWFGDRYLAVRDLPLLRDRVQCWPHFFNRFGGVLLDWTEFRDIDEDLLREDCIWFNRQRLNCLVDLRSAGASGLEKAFKKTAEKLAMFSAAKGVILPDNTPDGALTRMAAEAMQKEIVVYRRGAVPENSKNVRIAMVAAPGKTGAKADLVIYTATDAPVDFTRFRDAAVQVLDINASSWDDIYAAYCTVWSADRPGRFQNTPETRATKDGKAAAKNRNHYLSLHDIPDLRRAIRERPGFFRYFGGVLLDANYLYGRSAGACRRDAAWLKARGVKVIVDISRRMNGYPDLSWVQENISMRSRTERYFNNIFPKMRLLGAKHIVIIPHLRTEMVHKVYKTTREKMQMDGMRLFVRRAKAEDVQVSVLHHRFGRLRAQPHEIPDVIRALREESGNVMFAANTGDWPQWRNLLKIAGDDLGIVFLAASGSDRIDIWLPVRRGKVDPKTVNALDVPLVLSAEEYQDWQDVLADCSFMGW